MTEIKKELKKTTYKKTANDRLLILHNDDYNTFDYVIKSLIEICDHDTVQAEQCAYIVHFNGKCDVKKGSYKSLTTLKDLLILKKLSVTIE